MLEVNPTTNSGRGKQKYT